jgi:hypothetical protein
MPSASPRQPQQQPGRAANRQQQQSASSPEFQSRSPKQEKQGGSAKSDKQMGEGSYEATRDYQENIKSYLDSADVKADAKAAAPASADEAADLKKAEDEGLSHTKAPGQ